MLGEENPISHLSRIKTPDLLYLSIVAALRAYVLRPASLDVLATLGTTTSLTRTRSPYLINCRILLLPISQPSPIYYLLFNHYYIRLASPPRAIKGVRGIYPSTAVIPSERDILYYIGYLLCLGPSQALSKGHHSVERRQENRGFAIQAARFIRQLMASDRMLRGRSPQGFRRGRIFTCSLVRS